MEFKFDPNQEFQLEAIQSIIDLFEGQPTAGWFSASNSGLLVTGTIGNRLDLSDDQLLVNLNKVQTHQGIQLDTKILTISQNNTSENTHIPPPFYNYSIEMETGTGKTYVYIRTIMELYKSYGMRKFIIVVPSVAIKEGVFTSLKMTKSHIQQIYGNVPVRFYKYESRNISRIRQFATSDSIQIMIMTLAAFNKETNVFRNPVEQLGDLPPVHLIQKTRPILILDEPQNMESEKSIAALALLHPLFALRFSATHRVPYNIVYRMTPFQAYKKGLVKRIEVASVIKEDDFTQPYIRVDKIPRQKGYVKAKLVVHKRMKDGTVKLKPITITSGDDLEERTGLEEYSGYRVYEINPGGKFILFENEIEIKENEEIGADKDVLFEEQIRYTIEEHIRKQKRLASKNIKVLSLIFIDRVANYESKDGVAGPIREMFDRSFRDLQTKHSFLLEKTPEEVQAAYFAQQRYRSGKVILKDSVTGETDRDREVYELIMKKKEQLVSFEEPVSFIFSHSALREGWDNPNVFQICTLNQTVSKIRKRQEIGRGMRLAINQEGIRVHDPSVNVLTVVANESYESFVSDLQAEIAFEYRNEIENRYGKSISELSDEERQQIEQEYGQGILPPKPSNARSKTTIKRQSITDYDDFLEIWKRIKHQTRYNLKIDSEKLIEDVVSEMNNIDVSIPRISITKVSLDVEDQSVFDALELSAARTVRSLDNRYPLPNLINSMIDIMRNMTPPIRLTRKTLWKILERSPESCHKALVENPQEFAGNIVRLIKSKLTDQLVDCIVYERTDEYYDLSLFDEEISSWVENIVLSEKSLYDHVICDSDVERKFVRDMEKMNPVAFYIKLPSWFTVPTPLGTYNPDWAILWKHVDEHGIETEEPHLYLIRETKGRAEYDSLRPNEYRKIKCARKHFDEALGISFAVIEKASDLPKKDISF